MTKKSLGQNFLIDPRVADDLVKAAEITEKDIVLEVGAGTGAVTRPLAQKARRVIAVEIDPKLTSQLQTNLKGLGNVEIIHADILTLSPNHYTLATKIAGSIPYQITSPLIHKLLKLKNRPKSITFIIQKEVAEKITAQPPKASYLSNFIANFGKAEIIRTIQPGAFHPSPKVDSAILKITLYPKPFISDPGLEAFLHRGFAHPRKMIKHSLPAETLKKARIDPHRRPATLTQEEWASLYREIAKPAREAA
ncbi:MAG: 16S rRNA (adenine(1518)-N(6)/adenine(1519)-N(6)) -dimethyltransferase RsmA [Patescibacteria group bacterium]|nr:MAG: 16S rRNA (adenine(1518)-N(6)/adenine(1519)-N(6)) -dimethyltransferase RsmA [Patescibacteria group bacterium]